GVAALEDGTLLVAEALGKTVKKLDFNGKRIKDFFESGSSFGELSDVALDPDKNVYVVDREKATVHVFDLEMKPLFRLEGEIPFGRPEKVAINPKSRIAYVSDSLLNRVLAFNSEGRFLFSFGNGDNDQAHLFEPHGISINTRGDLYVADTGNARIQVYDSAGYFLETFPFGRTPDAHTLVKPWDLAFDSQGNLHILDQELAAFITCRSDGRILYATGASGRTNHLLGFNNPVDILVDTTDRILVTDEQDKRISTWQLFTDEYLEEKPIGNEDIHNLLAFQDHLKNQQSRERFTTVDIRAKREELKSSVIGFKIFRPVQAHVVGKKTLPCPMCGNPNPVLVEATDINLLIKYAAGLDNLKSEIPVQIGQRIVLCAFCGSDIPVAIVFKGSTGNISLKDGQVGDNLSRREPVNLPQENLPTAEREVAGI
ncbi:MAG: hypothetical protein C0614_00260, partial [Desulfuromonas sp.]